MQIKFFKPFFSKYENRSTKKHLLNLQHVQNPKIVTLCVLEVVSPKGTDLVLATHVPHREADVLVLHCLHIET